MCPGYPDPDYPGYPDSKSMFSCFFMLVQIILLSVLQPRISKNVLDHLNNFFFLTVGQNNFGNKIPLLRAWRRRKFCFNFPLDKSYLVSHALSFYRSQNVLYRSKFFLSDQKFIYILCQSQTFCARQKDDLHSVKLVFVPAQKFLKRH